MKKRTLTPDEKKLWKLINKETRPLHKEKPSPLRGEGGEDHEPGEGEQKVKSKKPAVIMRRAPSPPPSPRRGEGALVLGKLDALDGSNAERFRKGEYPIDATLDLHGMTYTKAHSALIKFMETQYVRGSRCLLIVTGKGKGGEGLLKQSLPGWLAVDELRPMILALTPAKQKHGGSGAYYVLLKRKR